MNKGVATLREELEKYLVDWVVQIQANLDKAGVPPFTLEFLGPQLMGRGLFIVERDPKRLEMVTGRLIAPFVVCDNRTPERKLRGLFAIPDGVLREDQVLGAVLPFIRLEFPSIGELDVGLSFFERGGAEEDR